MTRICIFGVGGIGGYLAVSLAKAGAEVSVIARGPHLEAIKNNGLSLIKNGNRETIQLTATSDT